MTAGMDDRDLLIAEYESIIEAQNERHALALLKLKNVERLLEIWTGYCLENGFQTGRLIGEVRSVLKGEPVMAGTEWL